MKLDITHNELTQLLSGEALQSVAGKFDMVAYDTRRMTTDRLTVFFALKGLQKDGHLYVQHAYDKGCRCFVVSKYVDLPEDTHIIRVDDTLKALQGLAKHHREKFAIPIVAITGSFGKTTIKEWLYFLLRDDYAICRSPKSYNSQLGVALALLELEEKHDLAIIEADISHPGEMDALENMISPTLGVFTRLGSHYLENFEDQEAHLNEHLKLFKHTNFTVALKEYASPFRRRKISTILTDTIEWKDLLAQNDRFPENRALCLKMAEFLGQERSRLKDRVDELPVLSGRQEVFEGINGNFIINDTYNIDIDALEQALEYQFSSQEKNRRIVVLDLSFLNERRKEEVLQLVNRYQPDGLYIVENDVLPDALKAEENASILFKGSYRSSLGELVQQFKNRKHETWVEFDLKAIQYNLRYLQSLLQPGTLTMVMVKASSYGTGDVKIPHFLQENGVDYLGVAYADEGATLRENGISLPIMVMNSEVNAFGDMIRLCLEPAIHSMEQLVAFDELLKAEGLTDYPVHLKFETGMHRLGFLSEDIPRLLAFLSNTDRLRVRSVFSHLADADNVDQSFTSDQISRFETIVTVFKQKYQHLVIAHLLNTEGVLRQGKRASFDMVRLGIGLFGYASQQEQLIPCIRWKTTVSQLKQLAPGNTVGYSRTFKAEKPMTIATLRIGYADGFRRALSNGVGQVFIQGTPCPVVGNVCMDMTMVDVSHMACQPGEEVEIIGEHQSMEEFAALLDTIPYEVMTSINKRVARVYIRS